MRSVAIFKGKLVKFLAKAGILFPSRSDDERSASPTPGEAAFNTTSNKFEVYDGSTWVELAAGFSHPTTGSTFEDGTSRVGMTGQHNTSIGTSSSENLSIGSRNTVYGAVAARNLSTGSDNTTIGYFSGVNLVNSLRNTIIGSSSLLNTSNSNDIVIVGSNVGKFYEMGNGVTIIGSLVAQNSIGQRSTVVGYNATPSVTTSSQYVTAIGALSGKSLTQGSLNTFLGYEAGSGITTGSRNVVIGTGATHNNPSGVVVIGGDKIGNDAVATNDNDFVLGVAEHNYKLPGTIVTDVKLGSNVALKLTELAENGNNTVSLKAPDAIPDNVTWTLPATDGSDKQVLTTDGSGALSWMTTIPATFEGDAYKVTTSVYSPTLDTVSGVVNANLGSSFRDTNTGNRTIAVHNLKDGQSVNIMVQGAINDVITITAFSDSGVTSIPVKYGAGQNGVMASTYSLFAIYRIGGAFDFVTVGPVHGIT